MSAVPAWLQITAVVASILFSTGGACAFLFVMWPAIRRQNRMADRMDTFLESSEVRAFAEFARGPEPRQFLDALKKISDTIKGGFVGSIKDMIKNSL
jgi:hypothetical protein